MTFQKAVAEELSSTNHRFYCSYSFFKIPVATIPASVTTSYSCCHAFSRHHPVLSTTPVSPFLIITWPQIPSSHMIQYSSPLLLYVDITESQNLLRHMLKYLLS